MSACLPSRLFAFLLPVRNICGQAGAGCSRRRVSMAAVNGLFPPADALEEDIPVSGRPLARVSIAARPLLDGAGEHCRFESGPACPYTADSPAAVLPATAAVARAGTATAEACPLRNRHGAAIFNAYMIYRMIYQENKESFIIIN